MSKYVYVGKRGNSLLVRNVREDPEVIRKYPYRLYEVTKGKTHHMSWDNKYNLYPVTFESIKEMNSWISDFSGISNFPLFGQKNPVYQYISSAYTNDLTVNISKYHICTLDIETARDPARGYAQPKDPFAPVLSIQLRDSRSNKFIVFSADSRPYNQPKESELHIDYRAYSDEKEMVEAFLSHWCLNYPDIMTGWNTIMYDIPYLTNRIKHYLFPGNDKLLNKLSPFNGIYKKIVKDQFDNENETYVWQGIVHLDYLNLYKKFTYNARDSYTLNNIAKLELGEEKVDYADMINLQELYENDYSRWVYYGAKDVDLVSKLEDKLKFIDLSVTLAYRIGCNIEDVNSAVRSWTVFIANELKKDRKIIPIESKTKPNYKFVGAYVKDIVPGRYNWVQSYDLASLYPHIQMELNISPEMIIEEKNLPDELLMLRESLGTTLQGINTLIHKDIDLSVLHKHNVIMSPSGQFYKKDAEGFFPKILKAMYKERTVVKGMQLKKEQELEDTGNKSLKAEIAALKAKQMAIKILLNSGYGALANKYFFWTDTRNAESITSMGQVAIQWIERKINDYLDNIVPGCKVIAADTDSVYIHLDPLVQKFFPDLSDHKVITALTKLGNEKIQPIINSGYEELAYYLNGYEQAMKMKMEVIAPTTIYIAKKRYLMAKLYDEGVIYKKPKIKMMGVDAIKSSTPKICRDALKASIKLCLLKDEDQLQTFVSEFKSKFFKAPAIDIAFPRSVNGLVKYYDRNTVYKKGCPIAVRGALIFNQFHSKLDIKTVETIKPSDKVKFFYMNEPNLYRSNILAFVSDIPDEFPKVFIDYKTQFQKAFLKPLDAIMSAIGWEYEKRIKLTDFFS